MKDLRRSYNRTYYYRVGKAIFRSRTAILKIRIVARIKIARAEIACKLCTINYPVGTQEDDFGIDWQGNHTLYVFKLPKGHA